MNFYAYYKMAYYQNLVVLSGGGTRAFPGPH
jgi:hypothetical protein